MLLLHLGAVDFKRSECLRHLSSTLTEQSNSEDDFLNMSIVHARMTALPLPSESVSPGASEQYRRDRKSLAIVAGDALNSITLVHIEMPEINANVGNDFAGHTELGHDEGRQHQASEDHFVFAVWMLGIPVLWNEVSIAREDSMDFGWSSQGRRYCSVVAVFVEQYVSDRLAESFNVRFDHGVSL